MFQALREMRFPEQGNSSKYRTVGLEIKETIAHFISQMTLVKGETAKRELASGISQKLEKSLDSYLAGIIRKEGKTPSSPFTIAAFTDAEDMKQFQLFYDRLTKTPEGRLLIDSIFSESKNITPQEKDFHIKLMVYALVYVSKQMGQTLGEASVLHVCNATLCASFDTIDTVKAVINSNTIEELKEQIHGALKSPKKTASTDDKKAVDEILSSFATVLFGTEKEMREKGAEAVFASKFGSEAAKSMHTIATNLYDAYLRQSSNQPLLAKSSESAQSNPAGQAAVENIFWATVHVRDKEIKERDREIGKKYGYHKTA